jgi:hypothetical protein
MQSRDYSGPRSKLAGKVTGPFWAQHTFFDAFIGEKRNTFMSKDYDGDAHPLRRLRNSLHMLHEAIASQIDVFTSNLEQKLSGFTKQLLTALYEATVLFDQVPFTQDPGAILAYLMLFTTRIKCLHPNEFAFFPCSWTNDGVPCATVVVVFRCSDDTESDFTVAIVNCDDKSGGLDYHPSKVDVHTGAVLKNLSLEVTGVANEKVFSTAYW